MPSPGRLRTFTWGAPLLLAFGCAPDSVPVEPACERPAPGAIYVGPPCDVMIPADGEGRGSDTVLANAWFRAVFRHPLASLTRQGVGGGTVVDIAPWDARDPVHEIIPIVGGGALDVDAFVVDDAGIDVAGEVVPLPGAAVTEGRGAFRWVIDPDRPLLRLEGADGMWVHPRGGTSIYDGWIWSEGSVIAHDGEVTDLGGALRTTATQLWVVPPDQAWEAPFVDSVPVSGASDGTSIAVYRDDARIGSIAVADESFSAVIPADATRLRAVASGRRPSAWAAPGEGLDLPIGGGGTLFLAPIDPEIAGFVSVADTLDQRGGTLIPPGGTSLTLGEGQWTLSITAGPLVAARSIQHDVPDGASQRLAVALDQVFDPGERVMAQIGIPGDRSWDWRGTDADALRLAVARGVGYAVVAPRDDIASAASFGSDTARIRYRSGSWLDGDGFSIVSWPWSASARKAGHGAPDPRGLSRSEALALVHAGEESPRFTAVDLGWLALSPDEASPRPEYVRLSAPEDPAITWKPWFDWLDARVALNPLGPSTWVPVADRRAYAEADVEAALIRGHACAGTGALVTVTVAGVSSGEVSETGEPIAITVEGPTGSVDHVAVYTRGGATLARWDGVTIPFQADVPGIGERWVIGAAWSDSDWAATAPVWVGTP